jgi:hypothetical protein
MYELSKQEKSDPLVSFSFLFRGEYKYKAKFTHKNVERLTTLVDFFTGC